MLFPHPWGLPVPSLGSASSGGTPFSVDPPEHDVGLHSSEGGRKTRAEGLLQERRL